MLQGEDMLALSWEVFQAAWAKPGAASMPALAADATLNGGLGQDISRGSFLPEIPHDLSKTYSLHPEWGYGQTYCPLTNQGPGRVDQHLLKFTQR